MAQRTVVTVVCDLPHDGETEGTETVSFAFNGTGYELDVCSPHAKDLREQFSEYVDHARKSGRGGGAHRPRQRGGTSRQHSQDVRAWAKSQGITVSERGRIPAGVLAEYEASH